MKLTELREQYGSKGNIAANSVQELMDYALSLEVALMRLTANYDALVQAGLTSAVEYERIIQRQMTENAALRAALEVIADYSRWQSRAHLRDGWKIAVDEMVATAQNALKVAAPVETAPAESIKVGDEVRIVKKRGILEGRLGAVVEIDGDKHVVKFPSGKSSFTADFTRDEIERVKN